MAVPTINFGGFVYDDSGDAVSGATVNLFDKNDTASSRASTTTNSSGYWSIAHSTSGEYDIQITSGSSKRRIKFDDAIQLTSIDTEVLKVRANEGAIAAIELYADEGEDASDRWRIDAGTDGVLAFGNDINSQGTYVDQLTITPNATVSNSTLAILGKATVANTLTLSTVAAAGTDTDKFLVLDSSGNVDYRTGTQVASDIGAVTSSVSLSGSTDNTVATVTGSNALAGEANLTFDGSTLAVTGAVTISTDLTVSGGDITYGNGQNATASVTATAHDTAGKPLTITAGPTTAGTTNNIAGGALTLQAGQGKGSGAGGDIVFQTANAGGSGSSLNALATALTISDDLSSTFAGEVKLTKDKLLIGGVAVTTTAAELNLLDNVSGLVQADLTKLAAIDATADEIDLLDGSAKSTSSITIADTDAFIVIDGNTTKQIPASDVSSYAGGGGTVDLVADGNIAAGAACYVTTDGKAKQLEGGWTGLVDVKIMSAEAIRIAYDPDNQKTMIAGHGSDIEASVVDVAKTGTKNTVTNAAKVAVAGAASGMGAPSLCYDTNADRFLMTYMHSNSGKSKVLDIDPSDDSIDAGAEVTFEGAIMQVSSAFDSDQNRVIVVYQDDANSDYGTAIVAEIDNSDDSHAYGSAAVFESAETLMPIVVHDANANKNVIFYTDGGDSDHLKAVVATIDNSDNSVTFGTVATVDNVTGEKITQNTCGAWYDASAQKVIITYRNGTTGLGYAKVGTISGTDITFGSLLTLGESDSASIIGSPLATERYPYIDAIGGCYDPDNNCSVIVVQGRAFHTEQGAATEQLLYSAKATISGTTLSVTEFGMMNPELEPRGYQNDHSINSPDPFDITYDTEHNQMMFLTEASSEGTKVLIGKHPYGNQMLKFIGFNTGAVSDGATATITVSGGINENQSSLTVGANYYIDNAGTLIPQHQTVWMQPSFPRHAGVATAATKLLVHGDMYAFGNDLRHR